MPAPVSDLAAEWTMLTRGELSFVALIGVGIVALALTVPGGVLNGLVSAVSLGLLAGALIALNRRRRRKRRE